MKIKVEGLNELHAAITDAAKLDDVKRVVKTNGAELQRGAAQRAPYDTGALRQSIGMNIKDGGMTAEVEATVEYAAYQEYGTRFMAAHPYMGPAFNVQANKFLNDLDRLMD